MVAVDQTLPPDVGHDWNKPPRPDGLFEHFQAVDLAVPDFGDLHVALALDFVAAGAQHAIEFIGERHNDLAFSDQRRHQLARLGLDGVVVSDPHAVFAQPGAGDVTDASVVHHVAQFGLRVQLLVLLLGDLVSPEGKLRIAPVAFDGGWVHVHAEWVQNGRAEPDLEIETPVVGKLSHELRVPHPARHHVFAGRRAADVGEARHFDVAHDALKDFRRFDVGSVVNRADADGGIVQAGFVGDLVGELLAAVDCESGAELLLALGEVRG